MELLVACGRRSLKLENKDDHRIEYLPNGRIGIPLVILHSGGNPKDMYMIGVQVRLVKLHSSSSVRIFQAGENFYILCLRFYGYA